MTFIYFISDGDGFIIGHSKHPEKRLKELQTANAKDLFIAYLFKTNYGYKLESALHRFMSHCKSRGEWHSLSDTDFIKVKKLCDTLEKSFELINKKII